MTQSSRGRTGTVRGVITALARRGALLGTMLLSGLTAQSAVAAPARSPVVLELFSSEGCSSCPPADELLAELDAAGEVGGTPIIALELHVDYWDYIGWRDPFSSAEFTARQQRYGKWLGQRSYTPQLVVDGQADVVGFKRSLTAAAVASAAQKTPTATVTLRRKADQLAVEISGLPPEATVLLAITERGLSTKVLRGENAGKTLHHGPVVRTLKPLATSPGPHYTTQVPLQLAPTWNPESLNAVVFVQSSDGHIVGANTLPLRKN